MEFGPLGPPWGAVLGGRAEEAELSDLGMLKEICFCSLAAAKTVYLPVCVFQGSGDQQKENALLKTFPRIYAVQLERHNPSAKPLGFHVVRMRLACFWNPQPRGRQPARSTMEERWPCHEGTRATLSSAEAKRNAHTSPGSLSKIQICLSSEGRAREHSGVASKDLGFMAQGC